LDDVENKNDASLARACCKVGLDRSCRRAAEIPVVLRQGLAGNSGDTILNFFRVRYGVSGTPIQTPTVGDFLGLVGTYGSRQLLNHVLATADGHAVPVQGLFLPDVPLEMIERISHHLLRSDHAPFWRAGLPALMWTDTAEFRNPHYHRPTDTPVTLDYEFLAGVTRLLVHAVLVPRQRDIDRLP
jgi:hypothetical protein